MKTLVTMIGIITALATFNTTADELPGKAKYAVCSACHGVQGQGGVGPALAGKDVEYIVDRLTAYRNNEQVGPQSVLMWGQAATLVDQDIQDLAEYVNSL